MGNLKHQWHISDTAVTHQCFFHQQTRPQMGRDCLEHCHGQFLGITSPMISMGFGSSGEVIDFQGILCWKESWLTTWSSKNGTAQVTPSQVTGFKPFKPTNSITADHSYRCLDLTHTLFTTSILRIYRGFTLWSYIYIHTSYTYFFPYCRS